MPNPEKVAEVAELTERFQSSAGAVLTEYRGLTVAQLRELRGALGEAATFSVVKNTLTKIAAERAGLEAELSPLLSGPSAVAFVTGDVVETAKGLRDFARANPHLVIKGGVLEGRTLTPEEITRLADVEPREVLLAKLAGALKATQSRAAGTFAALPTQMAQLTDALRVKREASDGPAKTPATETPAGETPAGETPAAEAAAEAAAAGTQDAGTQDAGTQDAGTQDAGTQDAGTQDTETSAESAGEPDQD